MPQDLPKVYRIIWYAKSNRCYVYIGNDFDPNTSTAIEGVRMLISFSDFQYYFNALIQNIGASNIDITHVEDSDGKLLQIFIGEPPLPNDGTGGQPYYTIINQTTAAQNDRRIAFDIVNALNSVETVYVGENETQQIQKKDDNDGHGPYGYRLRQLYGGAVYAPSFDVAFYRDGVLIGTDLAVIATDQVVLPFNFGSVFDTVIITARGTAPGSTVNIQWLYQRKAGDAQLVAGDNGTTLIQTIPGSIEQSGSFDIPAGDTLNIQAIPLFGDNVNLQVENVTDNVVLKFETSAAEIDYDLVTVAGKNYKVTVLGL